MENKTLKVYSWKEIVSEIKSPYNTYVFVSMRNSGKSKSIRNLVVELLKEIPHHNIILFSTTAHRELQVCSKVFEQYFLILEFSLNF